MWRKCPARYQVSLANSGTYPACELSFLPCWLDNPLFRYANVVVSSTIVCSSSLDAEGVSWFVERSRFSFYACTYMDDRCTGSISCASCFFSKETCRLLLLCILQWADCDLCQWDAQCCYLIRLTLLVQWPPSRPGVSKRGILMTNLDHLASRSITMVRSSIAARYCTYTWAKELCTVIGSIRIRRMIHRGREFPIPA